MDHYMALQQTLNSLVNKLLSTAAVDEILGIVRRIITEYEDQAVRFKQEIDRQHQQAEAELPRADFFHVAVLQEVYPEHQEWSSSVVQEVPETPHIKEEQEDVHQQPEDAEGSPQTLAAVKREDEPPEMKEEHEDDAYGAPHIKEEQEDVHQQPEDAEGSPQALAAVKKEDEPPQMKEEHEDDDYGSPHMTLISVKHEDSDEEKMYSETELLTSMSVEHMKTQAGVENSGLVHQSTGLHVLSSNCSEPDTEDGQEENVEDQPDLNLHNSDKSHTLSNELSRQNYITYVIGNDERPFSCHVCGKGFKLNGGLKKHMQIHADERPFSCNVCGKGFKFNHHLRDHMMLHTGEKRFSCTVCSKGYVQNSDLKKHMVIHTGGKPYSCTVCTKSYVQKSDLKKHMMLHTGERPYNCKVCGKGFTLNRHLKRHMSIHTSEMDFSCSVCGKGFKLDESLKKHMKLHTDERPFSCNVCGKDFKMNHHLKVHMMIHTGEKR